MSKFQLQIIMILVSVYLTKYKRHYLFKCPCHKMITFLGFKEAANKSAVILLKRRRFFIKLRCQIKKWENKIGREKILSKILLQFVYIYIYLKNAYIFPYLTFNSSIPSVEIVRKQSSCLLYIEKTLFILLLTNSKCIFHGKLTSWLALQSVGKSTHAAIVYCGIRTDSSMSTFMNSPGRSLILFGEYNTKTLFCNFFVCFSKLLSKINLIIFIEHFFTRRTN